MFKRLIETPLLKKLSLGAALFAALAFGSVHADSGAAANNRLVPDRDRVYVISPSSEPDDIMGPSVINVYDPATNVPIKQLFSRGLKPHHFYKIPNRNFAYISHFAPTRFVEVFDLVRDKVHSMLPTGLGPRHMGFRPDGQVAYTANVEGNSVTRIDVRTGRTLTRPVFAKEPNYVEYVKTPNGPLVFSANMGEASVTVLDPTTLQFIKKIAVGASPFNMIFNEQFMVTGNAGDNTASWIDLDTLTEVERVSILTPSTVLNTAERQRSNPRLSPDGKYVWIGNQQGSEYAVLSMDDRELVTTIPAAYGADIAFFPQLGPGAGFAFLTNRYDPFVTVAKLNGGAVPTFHKQIPVGLDGTHFITFNEPFTKAYVSSRPGGGYSVVDVATQVNEVSIPVGQGPDQATYVFTRNGRVLGHPEDSTTK